jgi:hypothetical protein
MMVDLTTDLGRSDRDHRAFTPLATDPITAVDLISRMIQHLPDHHARRSISPLIFVDPILTTPLALALSLSLAPALARR